MKETKNILENEALRKAPFTVPEGYFDTVEESVRARMEKPAGRTSPWTILKPALLTACMFLVILGIGYATLSLTGTLGSRAENAAVLAEASVEEAQLDEAISEVPDEELLEYLTETVSWPDLQLFLAESL